MLQFLRARSNSMPSFPGSIAFVSSFIALALLTGFASTAAAQVTINVTGTIGAPTSEWEFSGSTTGGWETPTSSQADGAVSLGSDNYFGRLNNYYVGHFSTGPFGNFDEENVPMTPGVTITGAESGEHQMEGFTLTGSPQQFAWFADGAFPGAEPLTFAGSATAVFDLGLVDGLEMFDDTVTVMAGNLFNGGLVINFTATGVIPEPSTALLLGLGLSGLALRRKGRVDGA